ncbi:hypothetical protein [Microbulbifer marinus]|uniref:O-Antigen ligase n=1 Tax=Microbulbifer marinus TaxID=658218 RepID=A0A1H3YR11_9GAMM|nr:hypothetical protein [Microbulbifer marinus]SEA13975.1 hypothetical protein SAMN05216562_1930 [Microbulbifer marinus]
MPNTFAYLTLICWPVLALLIYRVRNLSTLAATFWVVVGGYLILPVKAQIDLPMLPSLNQITIPAISAAVCCVFVRRVPIKLIPDRGIVRWLYICLLLAPLLSVLANPLPMFDGAQEKPGLSLYDALADTMATYLKTLPLLLGLSLVKSTEDIAKLLKLMVYAVILYSPLILLEIRISPQLHTWIYGFFPHQFSQQIRFDGFRPVVFLGHGLLVAIFVAVSLCATAILWRHKYRLSNLPLGFFILYLAAILILCKAVGAWILGLGALICIVTLSPRLQAWVCVLVTLFVLAYPLLAINGLIPYKNLTDFASIFGQDRSQSVAFRFMHEAALLEHAAKKIEFGWGIWGRHQLNGSVSDGYLIQILGVYGLWGYIANAGLLLAIILRAAKSIKRLPDPRARGLMGGALSILMLMMVDQIPNTSITPYFWLIFGGVMGAAAQMDRVAAGARKGLRIA